MGQGAKAGICLIEELINRLFEQECTTMVLLETMAGKGSEVGRTFEELRSMIELKAVHLNDSMNGMGSHKGRHAKIG